MPQPPVLNLPDNAAALVMRLDTAASGYPDGCNAHILPDGLFRSDDGRPESLTNGFVKDWLLNESIASRLVADFDSRGKPILYDYEHNSLYGDSIAAGWIDKLVYVAGKGLFAHVEWTPDAAESISKKEYLYSSPYFFFDKKTGEVLTISSVALTNNPALVGLGGVGLRRTQLRDNHDMALSTEQAAALTAERDALKSECAALKAEKAKVEQDKIAAELAAKQKEKDDILAAACAGNNPLLTPAQAEKLKDMDVVALKGFLETLQPVSLALQSSATGNKTQPELTDEERAMCARMGVTPDQFKAAQASK